jgi:hypothetical protein
MADQVASTDEVQSNDPPGIETPVESGWAIILRVFRALAGGISLVLGVLWILLNSVENAARVTDIVVGVVLTAAGLVLLMPHRVRLPRPATAIVAAVVGLGGTMAGLAVRTAQLCCMFGFFVDRGWPFHWLSRGGTADTPAAAYRLEQGASWDVNVLTLAADLVLWAYAGMLLVVIAVLVRRARGGHDEPRR